MSLWSRRQGNRLQPQSVNPRRGTISSRQASQDSGGSKLWLWLIGLLAIIVFLAGAIYYAYSQVFIIKSVDVEQRTADFPQGIIEHQQIESHLQSIIGSSMLTHDLAQLEQHLLSAYPAISQIHIARHWPSHLKLQYIPRLATVQIQANQQSYLLDSLGHVYAQSSWSAVPQVNAGDTSIEVGSTIDAQDIQLALKLTEGLRNSQYSLQSITLHQNYLELSLAGHPAILIASNKSADKTLIVIQDLLDYIQESKRSVKTIDLRYDRPILKH